MMRNSKHIKIATLAVFFSSQIIGQTIKGIDISSVQGTVNWTSVKSDGITFAFAKATEGKTFTDSQFTNYIPNGKAAGVYMGAYHFARPDNQSTIQGAIDEANHFLSVAQSSIVSCQLPPALDYETDVSATLTYSFQAQWIQAWCNTVQNATGIVPIIYTGNSIAHSLGSYLSSQYKLWYPYYYNNRSDASPPPNTYYGTWGSYQIWQYSDQGTVAGISGYVDMDDFNGTLTDLKNLMVCTPPACHTYYASLPYSTSFENTWITDSCSGNAQRLPDIYWKNSTGGTNPNGNDYWHRDDYSGSDWTSITTGTYSPAGSAGNHSAKFHNDPPPAGSTGALDLYLNLSTVGTKKISFDYIHNEASPSPFSFDVMLSTDGGSTFSTTLLTITSAQVSSWTTQTFTTNATSATSVLRFKATDKGTNDVGIDNLNVALNSTTSISGFVSNNYNISVYPNPTNNNFTVKADGIMNKLSVDIYNSIGQNVLYKQAETGENEIQISGLDQGVYYVTIYCDGVKAGMQKLLIIE